METLPYQKIELKERWLQAQIAVNQHLIFKFGTAFMAGEPEMVDLKNFVLRVPVIYTGGSENVEVGNFFVKADTNRLILEHCDSRDQIYATAGIG